jgi:hypothetical protein
MPCCACRLCLHAHLNHMVNTAVDDHHSLADLVLSAVLQALSVKPAALERRHLLLPLMVGPNLIIWRHQLTCGRLHRCTSKAAWGQHCVLPHLTDIMLAAGYSASMSSTPGRPPARDEDGAAAAAAAATSTSAATSGAGCTHLISLHMPEAFVLCCRQCTLKVRAY